MTKLEASQLDIHIAGKQICRDFSLQLEPGHVWGLLGRNGTGKTTLLHTLAGLRAASAGQVKLDNENMARLPRKFVARKLGLLLQHHEDSFPTSVLQTVLSGRHPHIDNWHWEGPEDLQIARQALRQVDMTDYEDRSIDQLSGGERQRVAIATLLCQQPDIYLLDEPNSHLDLHYQIRILDMLSQHARQQQAIIFMSLHDINLAARFCDQLLFLYGDCQTLSGPAETLLTSDNLSELFQHPIGEIKNNGASLYFPEL